MPRKNLLDPLPPVDLEELTRESETFDCSVPLASSGEFFSDDAELPTHSISWRTPVSPAEKKLKKRFRKSKKNLLHTQKELQATEKQLEVCQRQNAQLLHAVEQERLARDRAEADNTARQVALVISEAIHRGCCFSKRMRKVFRKNEKSMLQNCNKKAKRKGRLQRVKKPM